MNKAKTCTTWRLSLISIYPIRFITRSTISEHRWGEIFLKTRSIFSFSCTMLLRVGRKHARPIFQHTPQKCIANSKIWASWRIREICHPWHSSFWKLMLKKPDVISTCLGRRPILYAYFFLKVNVVQYTKGLQICVKHYLVSLKLAVKYLRTFTVVFNEIQSITPLEEYSAQTVTFRERSGLCIYSSGFSHPTNGYFVCYHVHFISIHQS